MKPVQTDPAQKNLLHIWRLNALNWILRGQWWFWLLSYTVGMWNATLAYRETSQTDPNTLELFIGATTLYSLVFALLTVITFVKKLGYRPRLYAFLGIYYFLSSGLFSLSALSGDARLFLYAFVILAAIFLDMPWNQLALAAALLNFAVMGWLNVTGIITIAAEHQYNASNPSSWLTGGIVFATLSISLSLGITLLLRSLRQSLERADAALQNEQRASASLRLLSNINQLIVREHDPQRLLEKTCHFIIENGYPHTCVTLLQPDGVSLSRTACAGISDAPIPECALQAIRSRAPISAPPCLAIPVLRPDRAFGVLIASAETQFAASEMTLFQELADDLAYALENIETENQRRAIAETATPLLTARDETEFWSAALQAVQAVLRADRAAIYVYEYGVDRLTCPYSTGLSHEYVDEINRRFREVPGARLFRDPQPVPVNDTESNPVTAPLRPLFLREGIRSYCVFPLFSAQKLLGAFVSYRNAIIPFSRSDLEAGQTLAHLVAASLQNVRLFTEIRAKANEQASLFIAAQEISASLLNPPALLKTFAKQLAATLNATSVYIISLNPTGETLKVLSEYWAESASPAERKPDLGRIYQTKDFPHVIQSMKSGKALNLQFDESNLTSAERNEYAEYGTHTKLFVPLMWQGQTVGYTEIWESRHKREFTQHEINLAQALSSHAASVIQNAQWIEQEQKHLAAMVALHQVSLDLSAQLELTALFNTIIDKAMNLMNASMGCLYLMEPDGQTLRIVVVRGGLQEYIGARLEIGKGLSGKIAQTGEALLIPNYKIWEGRSSIFDGLQVGTVMGVPVKWQGRVLGVLNINDIQPGRFEPPDMDIVGLFADQAAVALENARLYGQVEVREAYFRALTENSVEGVAIMDNDGVFTYMSKAEEKTLGYTTEETIGRYAFAIVHPDDMASVEESFREVLQKNDEQVLIEYRAQHANGSWRNLEVMLKNLLHDPNINGVVANFRDVTERKQAERALEERESHFRALIENAVDGIVILNRDTSFGYLSPSAERILGYRPGELVGSSPFDYIHPEDRDRIMATFMEGIVTPDIVMRIEFRVRHFDSRWLYLEAMAHNLLHDPVVGGVIVNFRDVTERKNAENLVRESEEHFRSIFNHVPVSIWEEDFTQVKAYLNELQESGIRDIRTYFEDRPHELIRAVGLVRILDVNEQTLQTFEASTKGELIESLDKVFTPATLPVYLNELIALANGQPVFESEVNLQTIKGANVDAVLRIAFPLGDKGFERVLVSITDITARKQAEKELIQAYDSTLEGWAHALELRDKDTEGHTRRVTEMAMSLARAMNIPEEQLIHIHRGSTLHDIGKVAVPDGILHKPTSLTAKEMEVMRQHPRYAYEMLSRIEYLQPSLNIPWCHHEHWDGTGYPRGLKGEEIPLAARIFSVVDVYDALTSDRPYRRAWSKQKARDYILEHSGSLFDPQVVETFLSIL